MDTPYTSELAVRTRRLIGLGLWAGGALCQIVSLWLWLDGRMSTHVFYHDVCMVSVSLFIVGTALVADTAVEKRGFDVQQKKDE